MSSEKNDLVERLLNCLEELDDKKDELDIWTKWTDSLEELSEIEDAFEVERKRLHGKTVLDVGTGCVKPLYLALKFEPDKIIGINEDLSVYSFASDVERKSKLLTRTEIKFYSCSFFDKETLRKILKKEEDTFDFVLVSKTLHHLRTGECIAEERDQKHECKEDEECCIYKFEEQKVFERLLQLGKRAIFYEYFCPHDKDDDKVRGRGGYFTIKEWQQIFSHLSENYRVEFIKPSRFHLEKNKLEKIVTKLRQVDCICFYVERK